MGDFTWHRVGEMVIDNFERNLPKLTSGQSLAKLRDVSVGQGDGAIILAAGPSIHRQKPLEKILAAGFKGALIATESSMAYCLRNDVVPDLVVTTDPHSDRIVRWFGDPDLTSEKLAQDDYFRRQDMDEKFADEIKTNELLLDKVNTHGKDIKIALATTSSQAVVDRVLDSGMQIFWWSPLVDDPDLPNSRSRDMFKRCRMPAMNAGGNVGAAAWMMADAVLGKKHVALTGIDFGYYGDTPYRNTQYYHEALDLVGEDRLDEVYIHIYNPYLETWFYTDPAYAWYREIFLEMVQDADCETYNCTEGGILFGDGIHFVSLDSFLTDHA
ncbi:MAG: hypothetical protein CMM61_03105 [Rhodospirillaceae bacterium]|nr:hypothetical protein [Rhodospirillaceae bacterium]